MTDPSGAIRARSLDDLTALSEIERSVVLDCTSGWAMDTTWRGVPLTAILPRAGANAAPGRPWIIRSATCWSTALTADEVAASILATSVAGTPLPLLNGAPCRLVVPSRRGLDWVKWVTEIQPA